MDQQGRTDTDDLATPAKGAEQVGISRQTASSVGRRIVEAFEQQGRQVRVKGLRFIPSTKVEVGHGAFQVIANTIIESAPSTTGGRRAEAIDSVVTIGGVERQELQTVKIPSLRHVRAKI
jgi:hypothetical protein